MSSGGIRAVRPVRRPEVESRQLRLNLARRRRVGSRSTPLSEFLRVISNKPATGFTFDSDDLNK